MHMSDGEQTTYRLRGILGRATCRGLGSIEIDMHKGTVTLLPFPRDDEEFRRRLDSLRNEIDRAGPERFEALLRIVYPRAIVRPRHSLGGLDPINQTWYVYRDGTPTRSHMS
jgi:hypothetical protein